MIQKVFHRIHTDELIDRVLSADTAGRAKMADGFVDSAKVLDSSLAKGDLAADTIRLEVPIPILTNEQTGLAADATGVKYTSAYTLLISADMLQSAKAAYIEADIEASAADSVTAVELYDSTAAVVRGSASGNAGDRVRSADLLASLVGGNEHQARINVTTASATAGATTGVRRAALVLALGIS